MENEKILDEKALECLLKKQVKKLGGLCWKLVSPGTAGVPDRLVVMPDGRVLFVELKGPAGRLSAIQQVRIKELLDRKVTALVCKGTLEEFYNALSAARVSANCD